MPKLTLNDFLPSEALVLTPEQARIPVSGVCIDTRQLKAGDAFFALHGHQFDGRPYIGKAIALGASVVFTSGVEPSAYWRENTLLIEWPNLLEQASQLAAAYFAALGEPRSCFDRVMAVTGTNGKTTCSHLYAQLWHWLGETPATIGTLGSGLLFDTSATDASSSAEALIPTGYTTPDAITLQSELHRLRQQGANILSLEASSHSLDQYRMAAVPVTSAVFTNLTRDHLDYHGTMEAYAKSKARLFSYPHLKSVVINADDEQGLQWLRAFQPCKSSPKWYAYSLSPSEHSLHALNDAIELIHVENVVFESHGIRATLKTPWGTGQLETSLIGHFNLSNLLAVITSALAEGADFDSVLAAVPKLHAVKGRMELLNVRHQQKATSDIRPLPAVVIDYAHTPDALEQALAVIRQHVKGNIWCVFGCGGDRDSGKRPLMGEIAARLADHVVITNDNPRSESASAISDDILNGVSSGEVSKAHVELDRALAIEWALTHAGPLDWVLIAGKGHEDYQIIGKQRLSFSDHDQALSILKGLSFDSAVRTSPDSFPHRSNSQSSMETES